VAKSSTDSIVAIGFGLVFVVLALWQAIDPGGRWGRWLLGEYRWRRRTLGTWAIRPWTNETMYLRFNRWGAWAFVGFGLLLLVFGVAGLIRAR
jgi:hypothetical protein